MQKQFQIKYIYIKEAYYCDKDEAELVSKYTLNTSKVKHICPSCKAIYLLDNAYPRTIVKEVEVPND